MKYVLDTGFFLSGMDPASMDGECYITPEIREEVKKGFPARKMEYFIESGVVRISSPSEGAVERIERKAEETGDMARLSHADISILALALELSATILSDDYSIQNIAKEFSISYKGINESGIKEIWRWKYRCTGCGRIYDEWHDACPVCGSPLKTYFPKNNR